mmetsp:Transcript_15409/g.25459  ORF Transcript_15409/g.25459 Transcript_15409/m.25459 type:complete len:305 (-) Transcript_15409:726-1640(-)
MLTRAEIQSELLQSMILSPAPYHRDLQLHTECPSLCDKEISVSQRLVSDLQLLLTRVHVALASNDGNDHKSALLEIKDVLSSHISIPSKAIFSSDASPKRSIEEELSPPPTAEKQGRVENDAKIVARRGRFTVSRRISSSVTLPSPSPPKYILRQMSAPELSPSSSQTCIKVVKESPEPPATVESPSPPEPLKAKDKYVHQFSSDLAAALKQLCIVRALEKEEEEEKGVPPSSAPSRILVSSKIDLHSRTTTYRRHRRFQSLEINVPPTRVISKDSSVFEISRSAPPHRSSSPFVFSKYGAVAS